MSAVTRETSNTLTTIWYKRSTGGIGYGDSAPTYETVTVNTTFMVGGKAQYSDSNGVLIQPKTRYWFSLDVEQPQNGDYIAIGDHSAVTNPTTVDGAEIIRLSMEQDCSLIDTVNDCYVET